MKRLALSAMAALFAAGIWQSATAATTALPPARHQGDITYLSGGVGSDQAAAIKQAMHDYPLALEFVGKTKSNGNEYLADVPVKVIGTHGETMLSTDAQGPFMLLSLPKGRYVVTASHDGKTERRTVDIGSGTHAHEMFLWTM
ncbi:carboxypeptidase family protein [Trinickia symbiotica]|uniref:Carboxypeptidase regulatory-like domain-containing protein n=1 Tax=Trinickia symbiotica TaxID=863227 RepID=A0A2N7WVJ7_9BURK|nr:carboxypeptidase regulatory-like domain-containing protein [Trinickia symbiotica]PMS33352.1 hypothetical protein C0Z20_24125 [Trinickia symbiotica]PPK42436.1 carboxypeptidase family protein [Trinickia symbiotica]